MIASRMPPEEITFRPVEETDFSKLTAWLAEPHVRRFYQKTPITLAEVAAEYGPTVRGEEPSICHLAVRGIAPFAYLQCYLNSDYPEWAEPRRAERVFGEDRVPMLRAGEARLYRS
jgi:hypothetical protein